MKIIRNQIQTFMVLLTFIAASSAQAANTLRITSPPKKEYRIGERIYFSWQYSESKAPALLAVMRDGKKLIGGKVDKNRTSYAMSAKRSGKYTLALKGADGKVHARKFIVRGSKVSNKISLKAPIGDIILPKNQNYITFEWEASRDEPSIMYLKAGGKVYKFGLKANERKKKLKVPPKTELQWWVQGRRSRAISSKSRLLVSNSTRQKNYDLNLYFGIDNRANSQKFNEQSEIESVDGNATFGATHLKFVQRGYKSFLGCYPGGGLQYSTSISEEKKDEVNLKSDAYALEANCAYPLTESLRAGPSFSFDTLPYFAETNGQLEGSSFQAYMAGGRLDYQSMFSQNLGLMSGLSAHAGSGISKYGISGDIVLHFIEWPILAGVEYASFNTSNEELDGYTSSVLSTRLGINIGF